MRQLVRAMGILGLMAGVAACTTTSQGTGGGLGETATQTIGQHPKTAAGAGVGAAGGAVVGGLAGGTKGAVIGGLLGALAGGAVGNYVERQETTPPQTYPPPPPPPPPTSGSVALPAPPVASGPYSTGSPPYTAGATVVRVDRAEAQPTQVRPGDTVNLNATYTVLSPSGAAVPLRETREIRLNGELVANPAVDVTRQSGTYSSALPITLPATARPGTYEVTTTVASGDRQSTSTSSFSVL